MPIPELYERQTQTAAIASLLDAMAKGRGGALVLVGPAGVGKSSLLAVARQEAGEQFAVRSARGTAMERDLPLAFAEQFLGTGALAVAGASDPLASRTVLHRSAVDRVRSWGPRPTLICLDDLHLADRDSLSVVCFLVRRVARLPVAVVAACRPWPPEALEAAEALSAEGLAQVSRIGPLSEPASRALLRRDVGEPLDAILVDEAVDLSRGNPLLVREVAKAILAHGSVPPVQGALVPRQRTLLVSHLAGLPPAAIACARAAAVVGGEIPRALLEVMSALPEAEFVRGYDALVLAGVLHDVGGGRTSFAHDLVSAAISDDMAPAQRETFHRRAFDHLYARGDLASAALHAVPANLVNDPRAVTALESAGRHALADGAVETALHQLASAVALGEPSPADDLLEHYADALYAAGRTDDSALVYTRLLGRPLEPAVRSRLRQRAARALTYMGDLGKALAEYDALLGDLDGGGSAPADLLLERAHVLWEMGGPRRAIAAIEEMMGPHGQPPVPLVGLVRDFLLFELGDPRGMTAIEKAVGAAQELVTASPQDAVASFNTLSLSVAVLASAERLDESLELIELGTGWLRSAGALRSTIPLRITRLGILLMGGRLSDVLTEADDIDEELVLDALSEPHVALYRAHALAGLGRLEEARACCETVSQMRGAQSWFAVMNLAIVRMHCALEAGDPEAAAARAFEVEHHGRLYGVEDPSSPRWAAAAVEAYLATGRPEDVDRVSRWLEDRSVVHGRVWPRMVALGARAGAAAARGERDPARDLYRRALDLRSPHPLDRARIALRFGTWLRRSGAPQDARPVLAEVLAVAERSGAAPLASRARAELAAAGGRRGRSNRPAGLTPQELRVAEQALTGASTREIASLLHLSPRTVETHLAGVYRKLGISSRRELLVRRDALPV